MNLEVEKALLGAVLLDPSTLDLLPSDLTPSDFGHLANEKIYNAILSIASLKQPIDIHTVGSAIPGGLDSVGGLAYLASLDLELPDIGRAPFYATLVMREGLRRRAISRLTAAAKGLEGGVDPGAVIDAIIGELEQLAGRSVEPTQDTAAHGASRFLAETERRAEAGRPAISGIRYGHGVDELTGGLGYGRFHILAGPYGVGKSAQMVQMLDLAVLAGEPIAALSLEMPEHDIYTRWAARRVGIDSRRLESGKLAIDEWKAVIACVKELQKARAWVLTRSGCSWAKLAREAKALARQEGVRQFILDHYHIEALGPERKGGNETDRITSLTQSMKDFATGEDVSFLALGHLSKEERGVARRRPSFESLRFAGAGPAHTVVIVWSPEEGRHEFVVSKNRGGPLGAVSAIYDGAHSSWRSE